MKTLVLTAMLLISAVPGYSQTAEKLCPEMAKMATKIMSARQENVPMEQLLYAVTDSARDVYSDLAIAMILEAYSQPRFTAEELQQQAIVDYGNKVLALCYIAGE